MKSKTTAPAAKLKPARGKKQRRSFSQENLAFQSEGPEGEILTKALHIPPQGGYVLTHRFHPYPGRFHPHLPRTLLRSIKGGKGKVCDPFMGGGTTLVEAILLGFPALGNDLNPIAGIVARERTRPRTPPQAHQVDEKAAWIAEQVEGLRREKNPPRIKLPGLERLTPVYQPHLLAELTQWHRLIHALPSGDIRETLRAVFSSGVVKFSNQPADSQPGSNPPRYPKGAVSRFFRAKCNELTRAQVILGKKLPTRPRVELFQEDSRLLPSLGWGCADIVITSPPYPGTYDYYNHHGLRLDWLELPGEDFKEQEIGPRRRVEGMAWSKDMGDFISTLSRIIKPEGRFYLVIADWMEDKHAVDAGKVIKRIASRKGWELSSWASAKRAVFSRPEKKAFVKRGKWEHLMLFHKIKERSKPEGRKPVKKKNKSSH